MSRNSSAKSAALARIDRAARPALKRASYALTLAGVLWPVQAGAAALSIQAWAQGNPEGLLWAALLFVAIGALRALLDHWAGGVLFRMADGLISDERHELLAREAGRAEQAASSAALAALAAQKLPLLTPYLTRYRPAMTRVKVVPVVLLALTFYISWAAGLVLLVAGPLIPVFMALIGMAAKQASERQMVEIGALNDLLIDRLSALADIRLLDATKQAEDDFEARAEGLRHRTMAVLRVAFLSSTVLELFSALGVAMVAVYVGFSLLGEMQFGTWGGELTLYHGIFILLLAPEYFQPLRDLAAAWHDRAAALAVAEEMDALEAIESDTVPGQGGKAAPLAGIATLSTRGAVVLRGGQPVALPEIDLVPGETVALCGPSGAGKTSCLLALAGLAPLAEGRIVVAGTDLDEATADAWRTRLTLIPQAVHMPDMTLRAFLDPDATGGGLDTALKAAHADGIVAALPDGLETRLGETGAGVSGGEARRFLVARAILRGADVVLADEPTADLDSDTAATLITSLKDLAQAGATVLVASHDPQVLAAMDRHIDMAPAQKGESSA
ncbi:thiol reductant ABC exporter subunit CydD [Shimia sp. FJ5]|uniref:thiol reductant ABC exporter subunit CydD n=1 Tax=Shimia sp. FJ5 TaxID=3079054 RepID=UPI00261FB0F9|nr:thiol reductant ABC exporter subunit CydD [Shimia sp. FJ5]MDV4146522.1 thiol reductant ABC exporter subunit CydD [Shimia sp. FJ5]